MMTLAEELHHIFLQKKLTLSIAESCTGGALSHCFTLLPGASKYYLGSVITYSNESKEILLDIPHTWIAENGAVSEKIACAMAQSIQRKLKSDYALATTGIAGPTGGSPEKPVGTVWIAIATPENVKGMLLKLKGGREEIIHAACEEVLHALRDAIR
ncbi:MAG: CinA family protein [Parachlamydiales bacterium]|jgi:PncC family amidohydrolase